MKRIYIFVAIAALFAACSSDDLSVAEKQTPVTANDGSVGFDAYLQRSVTRAGATRDMTLSVLQKEEVGFGVFGYYTDNRDYDQLAQPNFFYNQQIKSDGAGKWTYEPVKYWPNEYGNKAISDDQDRVTFFAYAPYVNVDPNTGKFIEDQTAIDAAVATAATAKSTYDTDYETWQNSLTETNNKYNLWKTWCNTNHSSENPDTYVPSETEGSNLRDAWQTALGTSNSKELIVKNDLTTLNNALAAVEALKGDVGITGMTRNTASGDPLVKYVGSFEAMKAVDLCWGVCPQDKWALVNTGEAQKMTVGKPWINVERPSQTTQPVKFQFRHALAKMQVNIDAFVDGTDNSLSLNPTTNDETRIWVRQVKFSGFTMKGALNLNNEITNEPYWMNYNGVGDLESDGEVVIYDGRKDGKEAVSGAIATNEKSLGLNNQIIETDGAFTKVNEWNGTIKGVTHIPQTLFQGGGIFYVIPTGDEMEVEIIYDVETINQKIGFTLADNQSQGTAIENRISKKISFGGTNNKLESGKAYQINLHLGMNSVEFDAEVVGWEDMTPADVDLPANVPFYTVGDAATGKAIIPYNFTKFEFGINGLNGGEEVTVINAATSSTWNSGSGIITTNSAFLNDGTAWSTSSLINANASGYKVIELTTTANTTTSNRVQVVKWKGSSSTKEITMTFTQLAAPLALTAPALPAAGTSFQLQRTGADYGFFCTGYNEIPADCYTNMSDVSNGASAGDPQIQVWRNGTKLTWVKSSTGTLAATQFTFTDRGKLTLGEAAQSGDVIKVTLKTGDTAEETISWKVAGASFTPTAQSSVSVVNSVQTVYIAGENYSSGYTATCIKDGGASSSLALGGSGSGHENEYALTVPAADYYKHKYVVTVTKTGTPPSPDESHDVTITQDCVSIAFSATPTATDAVVDLGTINVTPNIGAFDFTGAEVKVYDSSNNPVSNYNTDDLSNGKVTITGSGSYAYKFEVIKGNASTGKSDAVPITVPTP